MSYFRGNGTSYSRPIKGTAVWTHRGGCGFYKKKAAAKLPGNAQHLQTHIPIIVKGNFPELVMYQQQEMCLWQRLLRNAVETSYPPEMFIDSGFVAVCGSVKGTGGTTLSSSRACGQEKHAFKSWNPLNNLWAACHAFSSRLLQAGASAKLSKIN